MSRNIIEMKSIVKNFYIDTPNELHIIKEISLKHLSVSKPDKLASFLRGQHKHNISRRYTRTRSKGLYRYLEAMKTSRPCAVLIMHVVSNMMRSS